MNKIITLFLLLFTALSDLAAQNQEAATRPVTIRLRCRSSLPQGNEPLLVVNGSVKEMNELKNLDPKDIIEIHILKDATATALYGCRASHVVIIILMKEQRSYQVRDKFTNHAIPFANMKLIAKGDTAIARADKNGVIKTKPLNPDTKYAVIVDAEGYHTRQFAMAAVSSSEATELLLTKDVLTEKTEAKTTCSTVFPNPALKGATCTVEWTGLSEEKINLVIADMTGMITSRQIVQSVKGRNRVACNTGATLKTGTYSIILINESGTVISRNKLSVR